ncbi:MULTISPECIES: SDR family NAD(P)-dependent oxidoreductase [Nocardioides]|uniref:SDR family NAD(P)-dependent oxidoreductase n=1 Tax=Nocardioides vastitatis TaxID=2568655 RepID=A0ABW0ZFE1_9ACTN|nr:SDR family NAD(P)-dependent oxidoreductase [Nocardioides sp.]
MSASELALVTGASSGIGRALASVLVGHGYDVVVTADDEALHECVAELRESGREVVAVQADLATAGGVEELWRAVRATGRPLAVAALNAGMGVPGRFADTPLEDHLRLVDLNVRSTVHLAKLVVDQMTSRGEGRILVTASLVAVAPTPYQSTYGASKAFVHSFVEGIRHELRGTGVTVTSLMPGPTDTRFFQRADMEDAPVARGPKDDPMVVARDGFAAMMKGRAHVRAGSVLNGVMTEAARVLPDRITSVAMGMANRRKRD